MKSAPNTTSAPGVPGNGGITRGNGIEPRYGGSSWLGALAVGICHVVRQVCTRAIDGLSWALRMEVSEFGVGG